MKGDTIILGHRGAKGERPENTILGIRYALELGVKAIEIDVHLSSDGELVVIHDDTLDRTTSGSGKVLDFSSEEIRKLDAGLGEKVPFLSEVFDLFEDFNFTLFVEVKALNCEKKIVELVEKYDLYSKVIVKSFNHRVVKKVKELEPKIKTSCLIYGLPINAVNIIENAKADGISISVSTVDQALVELCQHNNYKVTVWNINEKEDLAPFLEMGVDFIGTDFPSSVNLD
jgi:glycerophosphoryl diester phosphodiesterase